MKPDIDISQLSTAERILLVEQIWECVRQEAEALPLTEAQRTELARRWAAYETGDMPAFTWQEAKKHLLDL